MLHWFKELDRALRGCKKDPAQLLEGSDSVRIGSVVAGAVVLGLFYGVFMGLFAVLTRTPPSYAQLFASAIKVPALFFLTLLVTFPSLYVFSALLGVELTFKDTMRLILIPVGINLAVLASLGPITGFFTLCTTSYPFIKLLNVLFFAIAGIITLKMLLGLLNHIEGRNSPTPPVPELTTTPVFAKDSPNGAPPIPPQWVVKKPTSPANRTFRVWLVIYALVGSQMGWILRPFIGAPNLPFQWFRAREANIFADIVKSILELAGGA